MFDRFIEQARKSVMLAQEKAIRLSHNYSHNYVDTEHPLLGGRRWTGMLPVQRVQEAYHHDS